MLTPPVIGPLLDPKNDFVFKKLFAEAPTLLADLINAVRSDEPPVEVVEVTNPRIDPSDLTGTWPTGSHCLNTGKRRKPCKPSTTPRSNKRLTGSKH